jgi:HSP20 family protein
MDYIKIRFVDNTDFAESEFRRTIEEMLRVSNPRFTLSRHRWRPQVDIYETREEVIIQAEIAGVRQEDIILEISPRVVKIYGTRSGGAREEEARYHLAEIPCGDFERTLQLPALIDTGTAAAVYSNGLLEIRLSKRPLDRIHKINVQHG